MMNQETNCSSPFSSFRSQPVQKQPAGLLRSTMAHSADFGHTRIVLPLGGLASGNPEEVREPHVFTFGLIAVTAGVAFAACVWVRLQLW